MITQTNNRSPLYQCPLCRSNKITRHGKDRGIQRYRCKNCKKTFKETYGTPLFGLHKTGNVIRYLEALHRGLSIRKAARYANISKTTSFFWRHKFLSSLSAGMLVQKKNSMIGTALIKMDYSAKGRKKPPEKYRNPTKTLLIEQLGQLQLYKVAPTKQVKCVADILSEEKSCSIISSMPNKLLSNALRRLPPKYQIKEKTKKSENRNKLTQLKTKILKWMERFKGVASKYLQQYWNWYVSLNNLQVFKDFKSVFFEECISHRTLNHYLNLKEA